MAYIVTHADGTQEFVRSLSLQGIDALKAKGDSVTEVADSEWATDAGGRVMVSAAAYQQAQAIATAFQFAAAQRALEQNQINAYGQQTSRIGQMVPLLGQTQNYGLLANVTAGDPRAPYLSVPAGLARIGGPGPVQPDYASLKTYQQGDVSDFAKKVSGEELTSAEAQGKGNTKGQNGPTDGAGAAGQQQAAKDATGVGAADNPAVTAAKTAAAAGSRGPDPGYNWMATGDWGPTSAAGSKAVGVTGHPDGSTTVLFADGTVGDYASADGVSQDYTRVKGLLSTAISAPAAQGSQAAQATFTPNYDRVSGEAGRHPGQSEWEARRDAWLGGQSHDAFQLAHSTTAQELNDVIKAKNRRAFEALLQRPAWTAAESTGSNWRDHGDGGRNPYRDNGVQGSASATQSAFDYGGPAEQSYHQQHDRTLSETPEQRHKRQQKEAKARERAEGGTDIMASKPSMFGGGMPPPPDLGGGLPPDLAGPMGGSEPLAAGGLPFDPHDPNLSPEQLQEVAAILAAPPSPSPSALEAAVRECWTLGPDGQPVYTHDAGTNIQEGTQGLPSDQMLGLGMAADPNVGAGPMPPAQTSGKPQMFQRGGTKKMAGGGTSPPVRDDWRNRPGSAPTSSAGAVPASASTFGPPPKVYGVTTPDPLKIPVPQASGSSGSAPAVAASGGGAGGGTRQRPAPAGGGGGAGNAPATPTPEEMAKIVNYYTHQFGTSEADARADLESGSAEANAWLKSALGMARAGQLDGYTATRTRNATSEEAASAPAAPAAPVGGRPGQVYAPAAGRWVDQVPGSVASGGGVPAGPVTPANDVSSARPAYSPNPMGRPDAVMRNPGAGDGVVNHIADATASMSREEALAYVKTLLDTMMGTNNPLTGVMDGFPLSFGTRQRAAGGTDAMPAIGRPTTFVARRPTLFRAGGQGFEVGEGIYDGRPGADELVSVMPSPSGTVVHVDPLQRRDTGIPAAVAATANLAVPGSPYRAKAGPPASPTRPGRMGTYADGGPPGPSFPLIPRDPSVGGRPIAVDPRRFLPGQHRPGSLGAGWGENQNDPVNRNATGGTNVMRYYDDPNSIPPLDPWGNFPIGSVGPLDNPAGEPSDWWPDSPGQGGGSSYGGEGYAITVPIDPVGAPSRNATGGTTYVPMTDAQWAARRMAGGGTSVISPYGKVVRPGSAPSATGQVTVPGARKATVTVPFYAAQPFPDPEYALSRDVAAMTPDEQMQVGLLTQQRRGMPFSQWAAIQQRGARGILGTAPVGGISRGF